MDLPCPFCGGEVDPQGWLCNDGRRGPECFECGATAPDLTTWNTRRALSKQDKETAKVMGWYLSRKISKAIAAYLNWQPAKGKQVLHIADASNFPRSK